MITRGRSMDMKPVRTLERDQGTKTRSQSASKEPNSSTEKICNKTVNGQINPSQGYSSL